MLSANNLSDVSSTSQSRINLGLGTAAVLNAGVPSGAATLDSSGKLVAGQFDSSIVGALSVANNLSDLASKSTARTNLQLGTSAVKDIGAANGVAGLDGSSKVPIAQLPSAVANGVASLDALGKVPSAQLNVGIANGIATLDGSGIVPTAQLPTGAVSPITIAKSADYTTVAGDQGKVIFVTTGSSTDVAITLVSAATAGDGATMIIVKADTGTKKVVVGSTLAWLSSQFDAVAFRSNGSAWALYWQNIAPRIDTFTANGTWTKPPIARMVFVTLQGPGGGGGSGTVGSAGEGGGGGAWAEHWFNAAELSSTESVTVPSAPAQGVDGNPTIFGTTARLRAGGGKAGAAAGASGNGSGGGVGGLVAVLDTQGQLSGGGATSAGGDGFGAVYGGGSGGGYNAGVGGLGGSSLYGGGGGGAGGQAGGKRGVLTAGGGAAVGAAGSSAGVGGGGGSGSGVGGAGGIGAGGGGGGFSNNGGSGGRGEAVVTTVF